MREARRRLVELLAGIGIGPTVAHRGEVSIQARRSLSDAEIATLNTEWLAIPAVDEFSIGCDVEMQL